MAYLPKRARILYETFEQEISQIDFSKKGKKRVKEFLKAIGFTNASKTMIDSLFVIDSHRFDGITTHGVFVILQNNGLANDWRAYYLQVQDDFRHWYHHDKICKIAGKPTSVCDIFRLYYYYVVNHK